MPRPVSPFRQSSFAGGELDPQLWGRTDLARYFTSLRECLNWIPHPIAGASVRPGTLWTIATKDPARTVRLIPFVFNSEQAYVLEVGHRYTRVHYRGAPVISFGLPLEFVTPWEEPALQSLQWAQLNDVIRITCPGITPQEIRRLGHDNWTTQPYGIVRPVQPPTNLSIGGFAGPTSPTHPVESWSWIVTSIDKDGAESLRSVTLTEANSVLYSDRVKPTLGWTPPTLGNAPVEYNVYRGHEGVFGFIGSSRTTTYIDDANAPDYTNGPPLGVDPFAEIIPVVGGGPNVILSFGAPTPTEATKITAAESADGAYRYNFRVTLIAGAGARVNLDADSGAGYVTVKQVIVNTFSGQGLQQIRAQSIPVTIAGMDAGDKFRIVLVETLWNAGVPHIPATLTADSVSWQESDANTGGQNLSYPSSICYMTQRLVFAGFDLLPSTIRASRTGDYTSFDRSEPLREDDSVELQLASVGLDAIRGLLPLDLLFVFTASAVWATKIGISEFEAHVVDHGGAAAMAPLGITKSALYVAERGRAVKELSFDSGGSGFTAPRDLALLAGHLFREHGIRDWCWCETPDRLVWVVREDGALLSLTYQREMDAWAWARHDTDGDAVEQVCSIPEPGTNALYMVVRRTVNGNTVRYLERLHERYQAGDVADSVQLDSAIRYDGRNPSTSNVGLLLLGPGYGLDEIGAIETRPLLFGGPPLFDGSSGFPQWSGSWVGQRVRLTDTLTGESCVIEITAVADAQHATYRVIDPVPASLQASTTTDWALMRKVLSGLAHLEGRTVGAMVDGLSHDTRVVTAGAIELDLHAERATIGLVYVPRIVSLAYFPDPRVSFAQKVAGRLGVEVDRWMGLHVGLLGCELEEITDRDVGESYDSKLPATAFVATVAESQWEERPVLVIEQRDPLPATLLAIVGEVRAGVD